MRCRQSPAIHVQDRDAALIPSQRQVARADLEHSDDLRATRRNGRLRGVRLRGVQCHARRLRRLLIFRARRGRRRTMRNRTGETIVAVQFAKHKRRIAGVNRARTGQRTDRKRLVRIAVSVRNADLRNIQDAASDHVDLGLMSRDAIGHVDDARIRQVHLLELRGGERQRRPVSVGNDGITAFRRRDRGSARRIDQRHVLKVRVLDRQRAGVCDFGCAAERFHHLLRRLVLAVDRRLVDRVEYIDQLAADGRRAGGLIGDRRSAQIRGGNGEGTAVSDGCIAYRSTVECHLGSDRRIAFRQPGHFRQRIELVLRKRAAHRNRARACG
ncbi:hypothetical protein PSO31014_04445 [Pandoraea soli]|uniref:Uncharacterized protein n=1 Tax=Pandoraea soli TaxID=2508293 RepID=A0ABY6WAN7_9BURK|nr:hypothetical protein PSO31014_04445 [Pandoraea soli]